jgi:AraC family transcriptional regulator of adaptative response / DNA-3-methyladenine glycosylase II
LAETDMPVTDVAMAVGFESLRTFYRAFKNQYEMTPSQYKKPKTTHHYGTN